MVSRRSSGPSAKKRRNSWGRPAALIRAARLAGSAVFEIASESSRKADLLELGGERRVRLLEMGVEGALVLLQPAEVQVELRQARADHLLGDVVSLAYSLERPQRIAADADLLRERGGVVERVGRILAELHEGGAGGACRRGRADRAPPDRATEGKAEPIAGALGDAHVPRELLESRRPAGRVHDRPQPAKRRRQPVLHLGKQTEALVSHGDRCLSGALWCGRRGCAARSAARRRSRRASSDRRCLAGGRARGHRHRRQKKTGDGPGTDLPVACRELLDGR